MILCWVELAYDVHICAERTPAGIHNIQQTRENMSNTAQKSWLSPFVAITYLAVSITGVLMLFHLKMPGLHPVHQWGGLIFVLGGAVHLLLNWRLFVSYFTKSSAFWGACVGLALMVMIATLVPSKHPNKYNGHGVQTVTHSSVRVSQ